jgi:hypothetical protein
MAKDPAILFYTSDFLSGTAFFTDEQRGQYIRLLCEQHQNGHIPERHMIDICKTYDSPVLRKFTKDEQGLYFQERMEKEIQRRVSYSESRRNNRFSKRDKEDMKGDVSQHMSGHMETGTGTGTITITTIDYNSVVENYHSLCPKLNKVVVINDLRKGFMNARVGEFGMEKVISVLRMAGESEFLNGKNDKAWKADFEWIMRPTNFIKILEGKYNNNGSTKQLNSVSPKRANSGWNREE